MLLRLRMTAERFCVRLVYLQRRAGRRTSMRPWQYEQDVHRIIQNRLLRSDREDPYASVEEALRSHQRVIELGETLLLQGERCGFTVCVLEGWLSLAKTLSDGQRQIIDFALSGDVLDPCASDRTRSTVEIEALTTASVAVLPNAVWQDLRIDWPPLHRLAQQIEAASRARRAERMLRLGKGNAQMRLAYALLELCVRLRAIGRTDGDSFHIPLTQQHLGDFAGLSSVHVCRTLRALARAGVIEVRRHMDIRILDIAALSELADVAPEALEREIVPSLSRAAGGDGAQGLIQSCVG